MARRNPDILAAEYVLGTLSPKEREQAQKKRERDKSFDDAVRAWEKRLGTLAETVPAVAPPPSLWRRIADEAGLKAEARAVAEESAASSGWRELVAAHVDDQIAALQRSLALWRAAAVGAAASAAAIALLWFAGLEPPMVEPPMQTQYVAMLKGDEGHMGFLVTLEPGKKRMMIRSMGAKPPESKAYELWLIKPDGSVPATLGIVPAGDFMVMDVPEQLETAQLSEGSKLAISLESEKGAPSGRSMGPVVFAGELMKLTP
ncbi:MAG: anti-sigma factor [Methyloligellaceae bacterium]